LFVGTYEHSLDDKGRLVLPSLYRAHLAEGGFVGQLDTCLGIWTHAAFADLVARVTERVRAGQANTMSLRALTANAADIRPDSQGRVGIPQRLRDYAGLERAALVIGAGDRIEVWAPERWSQALPEADRLWGEMVVGGI
jgi:MraZ protein